ncbi:MAG: hypothetical protein HY788_14875 [Deltaproteobacteria bacterium]|nr:hypothetical protein [Deltaproteobacteria bacterium]
MSIRHLALELYEAITRVAALEKRYENAPLEERSGIEAELWKARRDRDHLKKILEAKKEKSGLSGRAS